MVTCGTGADADSNTNAVLHRLNVSAHLPRLTCPCPPSGLPPTSLQSTTVQPWPSTTALSPAVPTATAPSLIRSAWVCTCAAAVLRLLQRVRSSRRKRLLPERQLLRSGVRCLRCGAKHVVCARVRGLCTNEVIAAPLVGPTVVSLLCVLKLLTGVAWLVVGLGAPGQKEAARGESAHAQGSRGTAQENAGRSQGSGQGPSRCCQRASRSPETSC